MNQHADRVRHERLRREWSVRDAAARGGISNTYWGAFEDYRQPLTPTIAEAVAAAFDWPADWADEAMPARPDMVSRIDELEALLREVQQVQLTAIPGGIEILRDLQERVDRLERLIGRQDDASN